jgi:preprotein translocase subunit SecG
MLIGAIAHYFFGLTIFISSVFLILLVLVQRGRGGGLTGALGGPGGQSAFGTKAGDLFTRITIGVATVWIFLCAAAVYFLGDKDEAPELSVTTTTAGANAGMGGGIEDESDVGLGGAAGEATGEVATSDSGDALVNGGPSEESSTAESEDGVDLAELGTAGEVSSEVPDPDVEPPADDGSTPNN